MALSPRELLDLIDKLWASQTPQAVLDTAAEHEADLIARSPQPEDAETCRQVMLAAVRLGDLAEARVWRVRATRRFAAVGWPAGTAAILMTELYRALFEANDGYPDGKTLDVLRPAPDAARVLDELRPVAAGPASGFPFGPDPALIARFLHEKTGVVLMIEGDYAAAVSAFEAAIAFAAGEPRGKVKVELGKVLAEYLAAAPTGADAAQYADRTDQLAAEADAIGQNDIAEIARAKEAGMRAGSRGLSLYEML
ncbi:MAG: hypothetical protein WKF96_01170 [Solirubrobacteraceae bacterium]